MVSSAMIFIAWSRRRASATSVAWMSTQTNLPAAIASCASSKAIDFSILLAKSKSTTFSVQEVVSPVGWLGGGSETVAAATVALTPLAYIRTISASLAGPLELLELLEGSRPVLAEQPRERAIGEQAAPRLTRGTVVRLV